MSPCQVGSIWTVPQLRGAHAVVLLGPYTAVPGVQEYVVAPVYTGHEAGFGWTDQDVKVEAAETAFERPCYIGVWNARPLARPALGIQVAQLVEGAVALSVAHEVYWGVHTDRAIRHGRLGAPLAAGSPTVLFHVDELARWRALAHPPVEMFPRAEAVPAAAVRSA